MSELNEWDSFYLIIGSAAGALIGLQFVVMTLIAERPMPRVAEAGAAFSTPTIVHFSLVLFLSALIRVPWHFMTSIAILLAFWSWRHFLRRYRDTAYAKTNCLPA